jgi:hypothetical protein
MIVRIRFGHGRLVTRRRGKNGPAARLLASLLSLVSISFGVFGFWRVGQDLGIAGDFVFPAGLLSHWQVWMAAAAGTQYACWRLRRYSQAAGFETFETDTAENRAVDNAEDDEPAEKLTARI